MTNRSGGTRLRLLIGAARRCSSPRRAAAASTDRRARASRRRRRAQLAPAAPPRAERGDRRDRPVQHRLRARRWRGRRPVIIGDWQEATQFNPYYLTQVTEANVASATWATLVTLTHDYKYAPDLAADIPTLDNGGVKVPGDNGDAMTVTWKLRDGLKWSDGKDMTCDDFKYAWEWVMDPDNVGVITSGFEDITAWDCPSATDMVLHFKNVFEGYITMVVAPPLPRHYLSTIPVADQVKGEGFRPDEIASCPTSGAFKFESVTPGAELRLAATRTTRAGRPASPPTSTRSCSSGTAIRTR